MHAQELTLEQLGYQTPYRLAKPAIEDAFRRGSSLDHRRQALVRAANKGYGTRAPNVLGNATNILASTPGGMKTARGLASDSQAQRKGAARLVRMVDAFGADSRYRVIDVEQNVYNRRGRMVTDRDLVFRHRASGSLGRIEVKDAIPSSQYSNIQKYKRQIRQLAAEQRATGQPQAFVNRRPLIPALQKFAAQQGVAAYGNVVTSSASALKAGHVPVSRVLDDLDRAATRQFRMRAVSTGFGLVMAAAEGGHAFQKWNDYLAGNGSATEASYHTLMASSGASFALGGVSSTIATQVNASSRAAAVLGRVGRYAGPVGGVLMAGAFGVQGYQFYSGELNTRQFVYATSTTGGAFGGGVAGAIGGGALGGFGGPAAWFTVPAGAIVGGIAGAWAGQTIATFGVESYYSLLDAEQQDQLVASLRELYENRSG
ncbi:hypothetical protein [Rubripirellula reticaptiva]|uniref:hypothetical protein n=1 Tax=Rubripirellula reticaptiva TaxID=2528013 RepID=UPI0011B7C7D9|nr:hypothetical protein [Rubripirellula reticaptiva]